MTLREARRIVEKHSHKTFVNGTDLYAEVQWTQRREDGTVESGAEWEKVPYRTARQLRDWLGY